MIHIMDIKFDNFKTVSFDTLNIDDVIETVHKYHQSLIVEVMKHHGDLWLQQDNFGNIYLWHNLWLGSEYHCIHNHSGEFDEREVDPENDKQLDINDLDYTQFRKLFTIICMLCDDCHGSYITINYYDENLNK